MPDFKLSVENLEDLKGVLGDAYAYRVGEGDPNDPNDPDIWDEDREGMDRAKRLAKVFGVTFE